MRNFRVGDRVVFKPGLFWIGQALSGLEGTIIGLTGHVLVESGSVYNGPVKCFRYDIELAKIFFDNLSDEEIDKAIEDLDRHD